MRHLKAGRQFGRDTAHRRAMFRALTANLVAHERIETTDAKAKELRRVAERVVTRAKRLGPVAFTPHDELAPEQRARRQATSRQIGKFLRRFAVVPVEGGRRKIDLIEKVMIDLAKRYEKRPGGYTRIIKVGRRRGDNAPMSIIEFVDRPDRRAEQEGASREAAPHAATNLEPAGKEKPAEPEAAPAPEKKPATKAKAPSKKAATKKTAAKADDTPKERKAPAKKRAKKAATKKDDAHKAKKAPAKKTAKRTTKKKA